MNAARAPAGPLHGRHIVITRPAHQAGSLAAKVEAAGGNAILFPAIEIADAADLQTFHTLVDRLDAFHIAIFISPNAVNRAMNLIAPRRTLPATLTVAALGDATVRALQRHGIAPVIAPAHTFDSEALLALPAFEHVAGRRVVIFRGAGGRELLGDTLVARGAEVEYAECYRRTVPQLDPAPLFEAWSRAQLHAFVVTSSEGLHNLFRMVGSAGERALRATPIFVPHARIADNARRRGIETVVTTGPGDEGVFAGLCAYFSPQE